MGLAKVIRGKKERGSSLLDSKSAVFRPLRRYLCVFLVPGSPVFSNMAKAGLDKPFWYHKWVTVRKADFCSECGKAGPKAGTMNAPKLKQCSKCKSVSYVSIFSFSFAYLFSLTLSKISFPTTVRRSVSDRALEEGTQEKVQEARSGCHRGAKRGISGDVSAHHKGHS